MLLPSIAVLLSVLVIVMATAGLVLTRSDVSTTSTIRQVATPAEPSPSPGVSLPPALLLEPDIKRGQVRVEIYNNSTVAGLADRVAGRANKLGWQVEGIDNWVGAVPSSTVYYPPGLRLEATVLARDLGIRRFRPAVAPMRGDRLTLILTSP